MRHQIKKLFVLCAPLVLVSQITLFTSLQAMKLEMHNHRIHLGDLKVDPRGKSIIVQMRAKMHFATVVLLHPIYSRFLSLKVHV